MGYPSLQGMSVDLPFVKFRYVKMENRSSALWPPAARRVDTTIPSSVESAVSTRISGHITVGQEAKAVSMGMDPIVSFASVVHELAYGRISSDEPYGNRASSPLSLYTASAASQTHVLDIIL